MGESLTAGGRVDSERRRTWNRAAGCRYPAFMTTIPSVMCVHAHPDDEALFTGGILARSADAGARTTVVTCTWREGDERVEELRRSLTALAAGEPRLMGYTDNAFDDGVRFCEAPFDETVDKLVGHIRDFRPDVVVTYDAFGSYGHPDHIHAHRVTLAAFEASAYPQLYPGAGDPWQPSHLCQVTFPRSAVETSWSSLFGDAVPEPGPGVPGLPDEKVNLEIDVSRWYDAKWSALTSHVSELARGGGVSQFADMEEPARRAVLGTEWFVHRSVHGVGEFGSDPFLRL